MKIHRPLILLVLVAVAAWYRLRVFSGPVIPMYGNTMYHVGIVRVTVESGRYPLVELSYGGGFRGLYVPLYRIYVASLSVATQIDPMTLSALVTVLTASFTVVATYALARRIFDNPYVGLCAAFFFVLSPELTIYTARAFPELLSLPLVLVTLYLVNANYRVMAAAVAMATALTHQLAFSVLVLTLIFYSAIQAFRRDRSGLLTALLALLASIAAFALWLIYLVGVPFLMRLFQFVGLVGLSPGSPVDLAMFFRAGYVVVPFFFIGLFFLLVSPLEAKSKLLVLSWFAAVFLLTKNDLLGFGLLMDRYFTFLVQSMVVMTAFGIYNVLAKAFLLSSTLFLKVKSRRLLPSGRNKH